MSGETTRQQRSEHRESISWPVVGFDSDLLAPEQLKPALKLLPLPLLRQALLDGRVAVRANALGALLLLGTLEPQDVDLVLVLLRDPSPSVRDAAARCAAGAEPVEQVVPAMLKALALDPKLMDSAKVCIKGYGAKALPILMSQLRTDPETADRIVLPFLMALGGPAVQAMGSALAHPDPRVRANSLAGLMTLGVEALQANSRMIVALGRDGDIAVRSLARQALTMVSRSASPLFSEVRPLPLDDFAVALADEPALKKAAKQLEAQALLALTHDGRELVRANAWRSLASLGPLSAQAALMAGVAVRDTDPRVRMEAATALRLCPDEALEQVLPSLLLATTDQDRPSALAVRQCILGQGKRVLPLLVATLGSQQGKLQNAALDTLIRFDVDAVPALRQALGAALSPIRENAAIGLGEIGGKGLDESADLLLELTKDGQDGIRAAAFRALTRTTAVTAQRNKDAWSDWARARWQEDASLAVRNAAKEFLDRLSGLK